MDPEARISHAHCILLFIRNCCPEDIRRTGLTVYGIPTPREPGGNTFPVVFGGVGFAKAEELQGDPFIVIKRGY